MQFILVGVNHQTAPIAIREKVAISGDKLGDTLSSFRSYLPHGIILSTCNRTEIYTATDDGDEAGKAILDFLNARLHTAGGDLSEHVYTYQDRETAEHLFRVASGLESLIVGEYEVLGQIRLALEAAENAGMVNLPLRQAFYGAVRTGRRVREETGISKNALSVSSVAVDLAANVVGDLRKCKMLVIGAGEAGRLVAKVAKDRGTSQIVIASRTKTRAQALASSLNGVPTDMSDLTGELSKASIVVACAAAPHPLVTVQGVETAMRSRPEVPLVLIDIAVPRNVEPEAGNIQNVFLYNLDNLSGIAGSNRKQREGEIQRAEEIVTLEVDKLIAWWQDFEIRPVVGALMSRAEEIRTAQLNKTLKKLPPMSDEQLESLEAMTKSIVTKILKDPIEYLKTNGNSRHIETVKGLFQLDGEGGGGS